MKQRMAGQVNTSVNACHLACSAECVMNYPMSALSRCIANILHPHSHPGLVLPLQDRISPVPWLRSACRRIAGQK